MSFKSAWKYMLEESISLKSAASATIKAACFLGFGLPIVISAFAANVAIPAGMAGAIFSGALAATFGGAILAVIAVTEGIQLLTNAEKRQELKTFLNKLIGNADPALESMNYMIPSIVHQAPCRFAGVRRNINPAFNTSHNPRSGNNVIAPDSSTESVDVGSQNTPPVSNARSR